MATDLIPDPRRPRRAPWIAVGLVVPVIAFIAVLGTSDPATTRIVDSPLLGQLAPHIAGPTIDGGEVDLDRLRGRWVLVNFFATWCVPCREEHDDLIRFHERHQASGDAAVVGVIYADDIDAVRDFRAEHGGTWPMVDDADGRLALDYGVVRVPESFLVAPDGTVVRKIVGGIHDDQLERLLAEAAEGGRDGQDA